MPKQRAVSADLRREKLMGAIALTALAAAPAMGADEYIPGQYVDPVPHEVITQPYRICQDLEELTARINHLYRKPLHKLIGPDGVMQPEVVFFKDVTSGHEVMGLTRELCADISHSDLGRPVWTADGSRILFMGNRGLIDHEDKLRKTPWPGKKFVMNADYTGQRALIAAYVDESGNVTQRSTGLPGKFNILDPRNPRLAYYADKDRLYRLTLSDGNGQAEHKVESLCTLATPHPKIIQAISKDGRLLMQDANADKDRKTGQIPYMPEIHLIDLNKKAGDAGFYSHHPFDYGLPEVRDPDGKVLHAADNNYQFHSLMFGKTSNTIGWNYGPMTSVGEYLGWSLDVTNGLDGTPVHGPIQKGSGGNPFGQYESHGRMIAQTPLGLYFSGPATLPGGKKIGEYGLYLRDYSEPAKPPTFITPGPGGHVAGGESRNPHLFAAHIQASSPQWRQRVKESDAIMWGDLRQGTKASVLCFTYSDVRGGIRTDRNTKKTQWSGPDNNDFRPYTSIPRPLLSPDATKLWFHSSMLMPLDQWNGIYVAVTKRPEPPRDLSLAGGTGPVKLTWRRPENGREVKAFCVYRGDADGKNVVAIGSVPSRWDIGQADIEETYNFTDVTAATGTSYTYAVTSEEWSTLESDQTSNALRISIRHDGISAKPGTPLRDWDQLAPAAVTGLTVTRETDEPGQYRLRWEKSPETDVRYYNVYFSSTSQPEITQKRRIVSPLPSMTQYLDWSAPTEGNAFYAITAVDRQGNESAPAFATPASP